MDIEITTVEKMIMPRRLWSQGVLDVRRLCDSPVPQLREYFQNRANILLYDYIYRVDLCAPLKLAGADYQSIGNLTVEQLVA